MCCGVYIVSNHLMTGIDATCQEDARFASVKIRSAKEVLGTAMTIFVTPRLFQIGFAALQPFQRIFADRIMFTCFTVEVEKVFSSCMGESHGRRTHQVATWVHAGITNGLSSTVSHVNDHTVSSTEHTFCLAVLIPVISCNIDFIALEVNHIRSTVNPPQQFAILLIYLYNIKVLTFNRVTVGCIFGVAEF